MSAPSSLPWVGGRFTGFTRLSKGLAAIIVVGYGMSLLFPFTVDYLALIPARTIPFAWNILTAGYFERSFFGLLTSILGLLFFGKLLEPIWGSKEFLKFIAFVNLFTSVCTFAVAIILYYATTHESYLYTPISGFVGVLAGFLVAVKQIMPDRENTIIGGWKLRAKWFPLIFVTASMLLGFITNDAVLYLPFVVFGTYVSWIYLRYFQVKPETNLKGDPAEEFAFSSFFPDFIRPGIDAISAICEKVFCGRRVQLSSDPESGYLAGGSLPGSDPIEATRRRERGARALEERLTAGLGGDHDKISKPVSDGEHGEQSV